MPQSKISWASAEGQEPEALNFLTWNCTKVSPGCKHCYAQAHSKLYPQNSAEGEFNGAPRLRIKALDELRLTKPGKVIFVNTHSDTFHEKNPIGWIDDWFQVMNQRPDLIFLLLTKRPEKARLFADSVKWTDNIWLGTSGESNAYLDRVDHLMAAPAVHRFISFEPLLEGILPYGLDRAVSCGVDWVIAGGESGDLRRPFGKQWAADIQQVCQQRGIPFYFKQGGSLWPDQDRELNGRTYDERPPQFAALHEKYAVTASQPTLF